MWLCRLFQPDIATGFPIDWIQISVELSVSRLIQIGRCIFKAHQMKGKIKLQLAIRHFSDISIGLRRIHWEWWPAISRISLVPILSKEIQNPTNAKWHKQNHDVTILPVGSPTEGVGTFWLEVLNEGHITCFKTIKVMKFLQTFI